LMALSTWVETKPELDRLLPRPRGIMGRIARILRPVL
jgi:hypothetical protein